MGRQRLDACICSLDHFGGQAQQAQLVAGLKDDAQAAVGDALVIAADGELAQGGAAGGQGVEGPVGDAGAVAERECLQVGAALRSASKEARRQAARAVSLISVPWVLEFAPYHRACYQGCLEVHPCLPFHWKT